MPREKFILIPGQIVTHGSGPNEGEFRDVAETGPLFMNPEDMVRLQLKDGDLVRLHRDRGRIEIACQAAEAGELPSGIVFLPSGGRSGRRKAGVAHGTGMTTSRGIEVEIEPCVPEAATGQ